MVRHAIRAGFIEMYRMTLNDCTDFERSYSPPVKHPKRARVWDVGFGAI